MQRKAEHRTVTSAFGPTEQTEMATMVHWVEQFTAKSLRFFALQIEPLFGSQLNQGN